MKKEIWKDIKGYEGLYQISNLGRVKSLGRWVNKECRGKRWQEERILKPRKNKYGYLHVCLCKNGKEKSFRVNRLVAEAFIPIPEHLKDIPIEKLDVGHLKPLPDGTEDKTANEVWNLAWMSKSENYNYGTRNKRISEANINGKCSKKVLQIDLITNEVIAEFPSAAEAGRQLGYSQGNISECCNGKRNTHKGFIWRYKEESAA